jgi:uncharacterized protein (TIGR04552 family)
MPSDPSSAAADDAFDAAALRLVLEGGSVIDWRSVSFTDERHVDDFLRLMRFDPSAASDEAWMRELVREAVNYVRSAFRCRVPDELASPRAVHDVFLCASRHPVRRTRKLACIVLKVCHVLFHVEARDLFHRLPMSEEAFGEMAERQVMDALGTMRRGGFPIVDAYSSAKSRQSILSKLLQQADTVAAEIYDRRRFRVVVREPTDVIPMLRGFVHHVFPFHLVVPGHTHNSLVDFGRVAAVAPRNVASGATYRTLRFVVDLPIRIPQALISSEIAAATRARTVCSLVEFQVVDALTARRNEEGENQHERYKRRQKLRVLRRLAGGRT